MLITLYMETFKVNYYGIVKILSGKWWNEINLQNLNKLESKVSSIKIDRQLISD